MEKHIVQPLLYHAIHCVTHLGLNPFKQNFTTKLLSFYTFLSYLFLATMNMLQLVFNWQGVEAMDDVLYLPATFLAFAKWFCLFINKRKLFKIIIGMNRAWPLAKFGTEIAQPHNFIFKAMKLLVVFFFIASIGVPMVSFLRKEPSFIFPTYEICNFHEAICYYLIFLWEFFTVYWNFLTLVLGFEAIFFALCCHAYVGLEMVKSSLREINLTEEWKTRENMRELMKQHNYILSFIEDMNNLYSKFLLFLFWADLTTLTFTLYMLTVESSESVISHVSQYGTIYVIFFIQLSMFCISGSLISEQSKSIANVAYDVNWYSKTDVELRNALSMVIMRSQKAAKISVGGLIDLDLNSFLKLMQNSISVYTLLKTISSNDNE